MISIIVPVYNRPQELQQCLTALIAAAGSEAEILVVDDASTDDIPLIASQQGTRVLRLRQRSGPAAARNYGAQQAAGEILFFVDADVIVAPDAVHRVLDAFASDPTLAAIFGSYDAQPRAPGLVSQYRNLLHHFVHQQGNAEASTFWAGCGAIRRAVFHEVGGFDERRFPRPAIEDIELGYRLRRAGHRIFLDKGLQGTHLKRWTLRSLIWTDVSCRALPWSRLIVETGNAPDDLNLRGGQRLSVAAAGLACLFLPLATIWVEVLALSAALLLGVIGLNRRLFAFFLRQRGWWFAAGCIPLQWLYYLYSGLSYLYVLSTFRRKRGAAGTAHVRQPAVR